MALFEERKHPRLVHHVLLRWSVPSQDAGGEGVLLDVSLTGARLEISGPLDACRGALFTLAAPEIPSLPRTARLRWSRRSMGALSVYVCGVVFEGPEAHHPSWHNWIASQYAHAPMTEVLPS